MGFDEARRRDRPEGLLITPGAWPADSAQRRSVGPAHLGPDMGRQAGQIAVLDNSDWGRAHGATSHFPRSKVVGK